MIISGLVIAIMAIVSYFSGENLNLSMLSVLQILAYPFIWLLNYFNYNLDSLADWFKELMKQLADMIKEIENNNKDDDDKSKKSWSFFKKDEDTSGSSFNYKKYLLYTVTAIGAIAFISVIYSNKEDIGSTISGIFHSSFEVISNYTWRRWFRIVMKPNNPNNPDNHNEQHDDGEESSFVNGTLFLFRKFRSLFKKERTMTREELERYAQLGALNPQAPPRDLVGSDMPSNIFDVKDKTRADDFNPENPFADEIRHRSNSDPGISRSFSDPGIFFPNPFDNMDVNLSDSDSSDESSVAAQPESNMEDNQSDSHSSDGAQPDNSHMEDNQSESHSSDGSSDGAQPDTSMDSQDTLNSTYNTPDGSKDVTPRPGSPNEPAISSLFGE